MHINTDSDSIIFNVFLCLFVAQLITVFGMNKVVGAIALLTIAFRFIWRKLAFMDGFVHSFRLIERMKKGFQCIYGYGIDEYFVLRELSLSAGTLGLLFIASNGIDALFGISSFWALCVESLITCVLIIVYCIQLRKYKSAFGSIRISFILSCIGLLLTAILFWVNVIFSILFLFFVYLFINRLCRIMRIAQTLDYGDHVVIRAGDVVLDSHEHHFYLIYWAEDRIEIILEEWNHFKHGPIDRIESLELSSSLN